MITSFEPYMTDDIDKINRQCFNDPWSKALLEQDSQNPNSFYAVYKEDEVLGYAGMTVIAGEANVTNVAVLPQMRRRGIGRKVLGRLIDICIENDFSLITLEVRKSNDGAIALYKSLGFAIEGERKKYYSDNGEDALIMTRRF